MAAGSATAKRVVDLIVDAHAAGTHFSSPPAPPAGEPPRASTSITLGFPAVDDDLVALEVEIGETGSHKSAKRPASDPQDLAGWSPEASHYVLIAFPSAGDKFVVVTETIRGRDPMKRLFSRLQELDLKRKKASDEAQAAARKSGEKASQQVPYRRLVFRYAQAADNAYLSDILAEAKSVTAKFKRYEPSPRGGDRQVVSRTLTIELRDERGKIAARDTGKRWLKQMRGDHSPSRKTGVSELGDVLGSHGFVDEGETDGYEEATLSVASSDGGRTTIAVDTLRDVFTYPVSDGRPSVYYYYDKVAPRLSAVAREEGIRVRKLNPKEIEGWLDG
ncbi:hypothetical protein [Homoserinibacter gongjuensis]|uniref:hypothetical protein n=1 Tax=Homoserinibacter gongjuensis TaxID=1162968 RepID=UPI0024E12120|nr:hypothetical protein [Homoserinibacter gongjuensis]